MNEMLKSPWEILYMNHAKKFLWHLRGVIKEKRNFPIGALVYFGPDDKTITKIVAVVILSSESDPILRSWDGNDVSTNGEVVFEISNYFNKFQVNEVVMTEGVVGCPHEEGVDYPAGEACPYCPYWSEKSK
jgi:hypothetical protein